MAEKRMFAKKVINSDVFMSMPLSTQALYFHLNMNADDEGFIDNPKTIMRMVGAVEDDLNLLLLKKYVIGWDSGIVVIRHWLINNTIRKERIRDTIYIKEKNTLFIENNKAYTLDNALGKPLLDNVSQMSAKCQHSIDKSSLGEYRKEETKEEEDSLKGEETIENRNDWIDDVLNGYETKESYYSK